MLNCTGDLPLPFTTFYGSSWSKSESKDMVNVDAWSACSTDMYRIEEPVICSWIISLVIIRDLHPESFPFN